MIVLPTSVTSKAKARTDARQKQEQFQQQRAIVIS
jgi:hypothetical protein